MSTNITFSADKAGTTRYHGSLSVDGSSVTRFHGLILEPDAEIPSDAEELETLGDERILTINYLQQIVTAPEHRRCGYMASAIRALARRTEQTMIIYPLPLTDEDNPKQAEALRSTYRKLGFKDLGPLMALTG
jgi:hypothetical protein